MKSISELSNKAKMQLNLPLGFGFHPTDEELITYYVHKKVIDPNFSTIAIAEVDIHSYEPWDLPGKAKMGEDEWYFYYLRDNKCKTGLRTKRSTEAGYWKSTGKDGEIYKGKCVIGKKKILVFYKGRAPKGEKTNWIMHEYRSEGKSSVQNSSTPIKNEWLIYRVFLKTSGGKKTHISDIRRDECIGNGLTSSSMSLSPPVIGCSPNFMGLIEPCTTSNDSAHVPCFSSMLCDDGNNQVGISNSAGDFLSGITSNPQEVLPRIPFETIQAPMNKALLLDSSVAQQEQNFLDDDFDSQGFVSEMEKIVSASLEMGPTNTDMMNSEISSVILPSFGNQLNSSATSLDLDCF